MKRWIAMLVAALALAAGLAMREGRERREERAARERIAALGAADLDGDGAPELVRAYAGPARGGEALVEAIDLASGEPRWAARAPIPAGAPRTLIAAAEGRVLLAGEGATRAWALALDAATGAERWRWEGPEGWEIGPDAMLLPTPQAIVVALASGEPGRAALVGLSLDRGAARWERQRETPGWSAPRILAGKLLLSAEDGAWVLDPATGGARVVPAVGPGVIAGGRWLVPQQREGGYVIAGIDPGTGEAELLRPGGQVLRLPLHVDPRRGLAGSGERLLALVSPDIRLWRPLSLAALSLRDGAQERWSFPAGYFPALAASPGEQGQIDPSAAPFLQVRHRFLPLVLLAESGADARLAVWDLEAGAIAWQSEPTPYGVLPPILQGGGGFVLSIPAGEGERALLALDGASGRFTAAVRVVLAQDSGRTSIAPAALEPWMIAGDSLLGAWGGASWVLRLPELTPAYRSPKVVVEPAWDAAEALLGPLPR